MDKKKKLKIASNIAFYTGIAMFIYYFINIISKDYCFMSNSKEAKFYTVYVIVTGLLLISSIVLSYFAQAKKRREDNE